MATYNYRAGAAYKPMSLQEMLIPLNAYKEAYEQAESEFLDLTKSDDVLGYLQEEAINNPNSKVAQIYNSYITERNKYSEDFSKHGLNINNQRGLNQLRRRYQGEIGRLANLQQSLGKIYEERRKNPNNLWKDAPTLDTLIENPNYVDWGISTDDLYKRGLEMGKNLSQSIFSSGEAADPILKGQYLKWMETRGIPLEDRVAFMNSDLVQNMVLNTLKERGALDNLDSANQAKAVQSVMNGIYNGLTYDESVKPYKDDTKMTAAQWANYDLSRQQAELSALQQGWRRINGQWVQDPSLRDQVDWNNWEMGPDGKYHKKSRTSSGSSSRSSSSGVGKTTQLNERIKLKWNSDPSLNATNADNMDNPVIVPKDEPELVGQGTSYDKLPRYVQDKIKAYIGNGKITDYTYYWKPYEDNWYGGGSAELEIIPRKITSQNETTLGGNLDLENDSDLE